MGLKFQSLPLAQAGRGVGSSGSGLRWRRRGHKVEVVELDLEGLQQDLE